MAVLPNVQLRLASLALKMEHVLKYVAKNLSIIINTNVMMEIISMEMDVALHVNKKKVIFVLMARPLLMMFALRFVEMESIWEKFGVTMEITFLETDVIQLATLREATIAQEAHPPLLMFVLKYAEMGSICIIMNVMMAI